MFVRLVVLAIAFLVSMPILSFGLGMISDKSDVSVVIGIAVTLALIIAWYFIGKHYVAYFKRQRGQFGKTTPLVLLASLVGLNSGACGGTIPPGYVGIKVNSYGANKGVEDFPALTGRQWYNVFTTTLIEYPAFVQTASWTHDLKEGRPINEEISFNTGDQMVVFADISLAYQLDPAKVPNFYVKFRADKIDDWTHGFLRNLTRQKFDEVAGRYKIEQIMGDNAPFLKEVRGEVQKELDPYGVHLEQLGFSGSPRPPPAVIEAINGKAKATQDAIRVENEVRQTRAQAEKDVAKAEGEAKAAIAKAMGEAKANELVNKSLTPALLEWRRLDISQIATVKWDGKLPIYSAGNAIPMIQIPSGKQ